MDEDRANSARRMSTRTRKVAPKMAAALASSDNRTQAILARLDALENDNAAMETVQPIDDDDEASLDDDDEVYQKKQSRGTKRKTRQAKALESAKRRTFAELLNEANLESLPPHVPTYLRAAVGPPSSSSRRHFCTVCGYTANYTCVQCGMRFCCIRCRTIHSETRCLNYPIMPALRYGGSKICRYNLQEWTRIFRPQDADKMLEGRHPLGLHFRSQPTNITASRKFGNLLKQSFIHDPSSAAG